jgi:alginate O-acetyltransferase complex protein AlgI
MPFTSLFFLTGFLPIFLAVYWAAPKPFRNAVALLASIAFYAWGAPKLFLVILGLGVVDFFLAHAVARSVGPRKKHLLVGGIVLHLSVLAYFKYANFFVHEVCQRLGLGPASWVEIALPIGISFLTFEEISALVDVYRGDAKPAKRLNDYLLFLMLFPHSIAGPIFRWKDLEKQLSDRELTLELVHRGVVRFVLGLAKKVLIANAVAVTSDSAFALGPSQLTAQLAWCGALAYALQIYFDFSGYSDMAIGLGLMMGFEFKENFRNPYQATSLVDFWQRWHISLSTWIRDYLYIPLGGNRGSALRTQWNMFLSFLLSGFWHGANWTFMVWGAYHGALVVAERQTLVDGVRRRLHPAINICITFVAVVIGWVFFRASTLRHALRFLRAMIGFGTGDGDMRWGEITPMRSLVVAIIGVGWIVYSALTSSERLPQLRKFTSSMQTLQLGSVRLVEAARIPMLFLILLLSIAFLTNSTFEPMIYFRF